VRYQLIQRRRAVSDIVNTLLICRDNRQSLFEQFRDSFNNEFDPDFRFDVDCKGELLLRTIELGDILWSLCEDRKKNVGEVVTTVSNDGIVRVLAHRVSSEAAACLQASVSRFITSVNVILDVSKALLSFDYNTLIANPVEECLPIAESVLAGEGRASPSTTTDKDKKGKDAKAAPAKPAGGKGKGGDVPAAPVPYRTPVCENVLNSELLLNLPEGKAPVVEEVVDPKKAKAAAPAGKGKKGEKVEEVPQEPYEAAEKAILELIQPWSKEGGFALNKVLYSGNEAVCATIEAAVWVRN
jgi:hypothetical protein